MTNADDRDRQVTALRRILETPALARVVPQLQPELLHKIIQSYGLEDCSEVVALATPAQLARVFDLDLWKSPRPGVEEQLDAGRFGAWLEVLMDAGPEVAAAKLTAMDADVVVSALSRHVRVFDRAAHVQTEKEVEDAETFGLGGYVLEAKRHDAWPTIIDLLLHLDASHPEYFQTVMRGCRALSNDGYELDGLDDLLARDEQDMFDLAAGRASRRESSGYVAPEQARVFLQMSRELHLDQPAPPSTSPIATAYFRAIEWTTPAADPKPDAAPEMDSETSGAIAEVVELLTDAGIVTPPRALLTGSTDPLSDDASRLSRIETFLTTSTAGHMDVFGFLANSLLAGCSVKGRPFTEKESVDATLAICNLGLEHWPAHWDAAVDLIAVFQVGWKVLYRDVTMFTAEQLLIALADVEAGDSETGRLLGELRTTLTRQWRNGAPWKVGDALDVIIVLDKPAWAAVLSLIAECPVLPAGIGAATGGRTLSINPIAFDFIATKTQIDAAHHFLATLPSALSP